MLQEASRQASARRSAHNPIPASPGERTVVQPLSQTVELFPFNPELQQKAIQNIESGAMKKLESHIRPFAKRGKAIPDGGIDQIRGDKEQQAKGLAKQTEGKIQKGVGDAKEAIKDAADKL